MKQKLVKSLIATAIAISFGSAYAATATLDNGTITARINDAGTFAESYSDPAGSPSGTPGLSYRGVEYVNHGTPISWYTLKSDSFNHTASLGSSPLGTTTYGAGGIASTTLVVGGLSFFQTAVLTAANILSVTTSVTNLSGATLNNLQFGVGFDPDQGISLGGGYDTNNTIVGQDAMAAVMAAFGDYTVTLRNTTSAAAYSVKSFIGSSCCTPVDPTVALGAGQGVGYNQNGDYSISLGYNLGNLGMGQTASIGYEYVFAVPEPDTYAMLLAGLGMIGSMVRRRKA